MLKGIAGASLRPVVFIWSADVEEHFRVAFTKLLSSCACSLKSDIVMHLFGSSMASPWRFSFTGGEESVPIHAAHSKPLRDGVDDVSAKFMCADWS